jgi:hypothetical protein
MVHVIGCGCNVQPQTKERTMDTKEKNTVGNENDLDPRERWLEEQARLEEEEFEQWERLYKVTLPYARKKIEAFRKTGSIHAFERTGLLRRAFDVAEEGWLRWEERQALHEIEQRLEAIEDDVPFELEAVADGPWDGYEFNLPSHQDLLARRKKYHYRKLSKGRHYQRWLHERRLRD